MEPLMVLFLGVTVGFIVLAILTPVFDLAGIVK
jgi:type II secretory pathway component PulF